MQVVKPIKITNTVQKDRTRCVLAIVGDTQVGLWVVRSLARNGLTVHAIVGSEYGQAAHTCFSTSAWALESNPGSPKFADEMEELARKLNVGSIMPVSESYHNALIDLRGRFEADIHLFSPSRERFDKATDKDYMQSLCPKFLKMEDTDEISLWCM